MKGLSSFIAAAAVVWPLAGQAQEGADAAARCLEIAGEADAGVPVGAADAESQRRTLEQAAPFCTEAAGAEDAAPEVLFHAAQIAQARGDAGAAFALLQRAAALGLGAAETRLGDFFNFGLSPDGESAARAIEHYQRAAELGDAAGMTTLALMYRIGRGVPRDAAKMVELLTQAAEAGYHFAQYRLAQAYLSGDGIPGQADAALGIPDPQKAVRYYTAAADAGNLAAALELATLYADPTSGLPDDPGEQARLTALAVESGHPVALAAMGLLYETGRGVDYDPGEAAALYVRALETGKLDFSILRHGASGPWDHDTAVAFQKILQERGLYTGALDGVVGPGTAAGASRLAQP